MPVQPSRLSYLARLVLGASLTLGALPMAFAEARAYHIAPTSLEAALNQFGREAGVLISFGSSTASGIQSRGLEGNYSPEQGLQALLEGAGLQARAEGQGAFSLQPVTRASAAANVTGQGHARYTLRHGDWLAHLVIMGHLSYAAMPLTEPPRVLWRLKSLRGLSHEVEQVFP